MTINICITTSCNHYLKYVASFLESLFDNLNPKHQYHLFLLSNETIDKNLEKNLFRKKYKNFEVTLIHVDEEKVFGQYENLRDKNKILLYRFVLSDYVNDDRCLFMDYDIIIRGDISELYFIDLGENIIGAAKDYLLRDTNIIKENKITEYFNAGVQLIDLKKRRQQGLKIKALNFLNSNCDKLPFYDQDTLNILLKNKRKSICPKRNGMNISTFTNKGTQYTKEEFEELKHPVIVHYAGNLNRPRGGLICMHPRRYLYYKYIFRTKFWDISDIYKFPLRILTSNYLCRTLFKIVRTLSHQ